RRAPRRALTRPIPGLRPVLPRHRGEELTRPIPGLRPVLPRHRGEELTRPIPGLRPVLPRHCGKSWPSREPDALLFPQRTQDRVQYIAEVSGDFGDRYAKQSMT